MAIIREFPAFGKAGIVVLFVVRDILTGALAMALVFALASPAGAALAGKTIQVLTGVDIYVDGVEMKPTDANGKPVDTFVYNGTTYVPLRAVSQYLGKAVSYDGKNQRVYIGEAPGMKQYLLNVCPPYQTGAYRERTTVNMCGIKYANGMSLGGLSDGYALFNLNGQYDSFSFVAGHIDGAYMSKGQQYNIYLDGELAFSVDLDPEAMPQRYEVPLHGAVQMKIEGTQSAEYFALADMVVE